MGSPVTVEMGKFPWKMEARQCSEFNAKENTVEPRVLLSTGPLLPFPKCWRWPHQLQAGASAAAPPDHVNSLRLPK